MITAEYIPRENFNKWYELFKHSGGRLLSNPIDSNKVYVQYTFDDIDSYTEFQKNYLRLTTNIIETRRGIWKRFAKRLGL